MCCTYVGITHDKPRWGFYVEDVQLKQKQKGKEETLRLIEMEMQQKVKYLNGNLHIGRDSQKNETRHKETDIHRYKDRQRVRERQVRPHIG